MLKANKQDWAWGMVGRNATGLLIIEQEYMGQRYRVRLLRPYSTIKVADAKDEMGNKIRIVIARGYKYDDNADSRVSQDGYSAYPDGGTTESLPKDEVIGSVMGDYIMLWILPGEDGALPEKLDWAHPNLVIPSAKYFD